MEAKNPREPNFGKPWGRLESQEEGSKDVTCSTLLFSRLLGTNDDYKAPVDGFIRRNIYYVERAGYQH